MTEELAKPRKPAERPSALGLMAARLNVEPDKLLNTLKATVFKGATNEELLTLVVISNEYQLNPLIREIHGFSKGKEGGVQPIVGVDGWIKIINRHPKFDGMKAPISFDKDGKPDSCTCTIWVKGRKHPTEVTEYYDECYRNTPPWNTMPKRMMRHKGISQCARVAFGISGIQDPDEALDTMKNATAHEVIPTFDLPVPTASEPEQNKSERGLAVKSADPLPLLVSKLKEFGVPEKAFCQGLSLLGYDLGDIETVDEIPMPLLKQIVTMDMGKLLDEMEAKANK